MPGTSPGSVLPPGARGHCVAGVSVWPVVRGRRISLIVAQEARQGQTSPGEQAPGPRDAAGPFLVGQEQEPLGKRGPSSPTTGRVAAPHEEGRRTELSQVISLGSWAWFLKVLEPLLPARQPMDFLPPPEPSLASHVHPHLTPLSWAASTPHLGSSHLHWPPRKHALKTPTNSQIRGG